MTRAERLFALLGDLDDDLVDEAAQFVPAPSRLRSTNWKRWGALCACALLAVGLLNLSHIRMGNTASSSDGSENRTGDFSPFDPPSDNEPGETYGDSMGSVPGEAAGSPAASDTYGTLIAEDSAPMDDQPCQLYYRESDGQWILVHGEYAIDLTEQMSGLSELDGGKLSDAVYFSVNGRLEGEFDPPEHVFFENYVLIAYGTRPGPSTCLVVGLNADGSFDVDVSLYLSMGE